MTPQETDQTCLRVSRSLPQRRGSGVACRRVGGTRTQEKGAMTPQETDPDLPVSVQECQAEARVGGGLLQGWGHRVQQCTHGTF